MRKRFTYVAASSLVIAASALFCADVAFAADAAPRSREEIAKLRASRPRRAVAQAPAKAPVMAGDKKLYGLHAFSYDGPLDGWYGAVEIQANAQAKKVHEMSVMPFTGCYMGNHKLFVVSYDSWSMGNYVTYNVWDTSTWTLESNGQYTITSPNVLAYGATYDHTTETVYASFYANPNKFIGTSDAQFGYIDFSNIYDPIKIVAELPTRMRAMTTDAEGNLYGLSYDCELYSINKFTGEATKTGVSFNLPAVGDPTDPWWGYGREGMCCDWETGDFYLSYGDSDDTYIAKLNPKTGAVTLLVDYSWDGAGVPGITATETESAITGLWFEQEYATSDVIPAAVDDLDVVLNGTSLTAGVTFTVPAKDTNGNAISGNLAWTITDGSNELLSGTAAAGAKVSENVTVAAPGFTNVVVTTTLDGKTGNPANVRKFFGPDTPVVWGLPTVRAAGNRLTVTWSEAYSENGGNLDPVTYKVTRMPDEVVVAEACTEPTFTDEITSEYKAYYSYIIEPKAGAVAGQPVNSRSIFAGKYFAMPHKDTFDNQALLLEYPIIDNNGDNVIWDYSSRKNEVSKVPGVAVIQTNPAPDDYLLIGPFKMEAGSTYTFHMVADGHNFREHIAVYVGNNPDDVKSFDTEIVPPTALEPMKGMKTFEASYEPTASGDYYFGIKACTDGTSQYIYLYEVGVKEIGNNCPAAPSAIESIPGPTTADIKFTLPSKNIDGSSISALTEARIYRDGELIGTMTDGVAPGAELSFTDEDEVSQGFHSYNVSAVSAAGEGKTAQVQQWRGADYPGRPTNLRMWEDLETPGLMHLTYEHPERGYYGGYVNPDEIWYLVNYLVLGKDSGTLNLGYGTDNTFQLPFEITTQDILGASIYGRNDYGVVANSTNWTTQVAYFGPAMQLPVRESWPNQTQKSGIWGGQSITDKPALGESYWDIRDGSTSEIKPQDGDAGMMTLTSTEDGTGKRVLSPRVTLKDTKNPTLVFYYAYSENAIDFDLEVVVDDQPVKVLRNMDLSPANTGKWQRVEVKLDEFKNNKYIQLAFTGHGKESTDYICIDNVTIADLTPYDLSVVSFEAPVKSDINAELNLALTLRNNGANDIKGSQYTVKFFKNDNLLDEVDGKDIAADAQLTFTLADTPMVTDPASTEYYAEIVFDQDSNLDDNTTARSSVRIIVPDYPTVTDLKAANGRGVELSWSDPDMNAIPGMSVTETFENYQSFIIDNIGPWTVYDGDKKRTVILATTMGVLEYPHIGEPMAWQVMDPDAAGIFLSAWTARSGSKILASFQASEDNNRQLDSEDWLISPELNGSEQVISFYSRAGQAGAGAPEAFDFMISSKTDAIADFRVFVADEDVYYTTDWVEYTYRVPAGTRYFAIVHKSFNKVAMLLDDITYIPAGSSPVQLDLQGFNVYRDGKRLNSEPVGDNTYADTDIENGRDYTYQVTPVYDKGEAALSNAVTIKANSSVNSLVSYDLTITGREGFIRIEGGIGEDVAVFNTAGVCVALVKARGTVDVPVPAAGFYLVKAGNAVAKVAVR